MKGQEEVSVELTERETNRIMNFLEEIMKTLAYAQGRKEKYAARRDEFKVISFPDNPK